MKRQEGFTIIELLVAILFVVAAGVIFLIQKNNIEIGARDDQRKTAVNAIYHSLEEVYYKENKSYPQEITEKTLSSVDPALFEDPGGTTIGDFGSDYRYEPSGCDKGECKSYNLRATLENEDDFVKKSQQ